MNVSLDICHFEIIILDEAGRHAGKKKCVSQKEREPPSRQLLQDFPSPAKILSFRLWNCFSHETHDEFTIVNPEKFFHHRHHAPLTVTNIWLLRSKLTKRYFPKKKHFPLAYYYCYLCKHNIYEDKILWSGKCMNLIAELIFYVSLLSSFLVSVIIRKLIDRRRGTRWKIEFLKPKA